MHIIIVHIERQCHNTKRYMQIHREYQKVLFAIKGNEKYCYPREILLKQENKTRKSYHFDLINIKSNEFIVYL